MSSIVSTILFKKIPQQQSAGRFIKFDKTDPDIRFSTGTMRERVIGYLAARNEPLTAKDIALGISSNTSRVYAQLKKLVGEGVLDVVSHNGFHPEYVIRPGFKE
jgi:hypothetical protein